jgi:hypothetical protein
MQDGVCSERTMSAPSIDESDCGYWPTPKAQNANGPAIHGQGGMDLRSAVMFPTPRASEWKGTGPEGSKSQIHMKDRNYLCAVLSTGGQLNPTWVEWLMGWPLGWTDLKPLAMGKFQEWLQQHGKY